MKKINQIKSAFLLVMLMLLFSCTDETRPENIIEVVEQESYLNINNSEVKMITVIRLVVDPVSETIVQREILSRSIDGVEMIKSVGNEWKISIENKTPNDNGINQREMEWETANEDCVQGRETSRSSPQSVLEFLMGMCETVTFETCFSTSIQNGVITTDVTYTELSTSRHRCLPN